MGTVDTAPEPVKAAVVPTLKVVDKFVGGVVNPAVDDVVEPAVGAVRDAVALPLDPPSVPAIPPLSPVVPGTSGTVPPVDLPVAEPGLSPAQTAIRAMEPVVVRALSASSLSSESTADATAGQSVSGVDELTRVTANRTVAASNGGPSDDSPTEPLLLGVAPASNGGSAASGGSYSPAGVVAGEGIQYLPPTLAETDFQKSIATAEGVRPGQRPD